MVFWEKHEDTGRTKFPSNNSGPETNIHSKLCFMNTLGGTLSLHRKSQQNNN